MSGAVNFIPPSWNAAEQVQKVGILVWDVGTLAWIKQGPITGGGGGGGAVTIADGADVAEGATTDVAVDSDVSGTVSGKLRGLVKILASVWDSVNGRLKVDGSAVTQYSTQMDYDGSGNVIYFGIAEPGTAVGTAAWQIRRLDYSGGGNVLDVVYANGSRAFNQAWTGRLALAYS